MTTPKMASTTALWFPIEAAFTELEALCTEARAAELAAARVRDEARLLKNIAAGGRMTLDPRSFEAMRAQPNDLRQYPKAEELSRDLAFLEAHPDGADLVELRARFRKRLLTLKARFSEALTEHEVYYALFPIVVYCDELMNAVTRGENARWEPLQSELYDIDNGGEVFYSILEERLRQEETLPLIFEVFYFCLNDGFLGMYVTDPKKIEEYKLRLTERIPIKATSLEDLDQKDAAPVELVDFPWRYYATAAGAVVAGYALLSWLAMSAS